MEIAAFLVSVLSVVAGIGVVVSRRPLYSALFLVLTLFFVASQYAIINAHFLAAMQILVYAGAIMVLVIFVIMLLGLDVQTEEGRGGLRGVIPAILTGLFVVLICTVILSGLGYLPQLTVGDATQVDGSVAAVGRSMFTQYLYHFELTSALILAGIVGAVVLGFEGKRSLKPGRGLKAKRESIGGGE